MPTSEQPHLPKQPLNSEELSSAADTEKTIPVIEEQVRIDKHLVETGKVHISKRVYDENTPVEVTETWEEVQVERVPFNHSVSAPPSVRYEDNVMIIPVVREEVVVEKRLVLVEEIRITTHQREKKRSEQITLRKEEVSITRDKPNTTEPNL